MGRWERAWGTKEGSGTLRKSDGEETVAKWFKSSFLVAVAKSIHVGLDFASCSIFMVVPPHNHWLPQEFLQARHCTKSLGPIIWAEIEKRAFFYANVT